LTQPTPDNERPPIAAAIIVQDGRVLLVQRRVKEGSLSWQFPAGEVEPGESASAAAVRETREETGLTVADKKVLGERIHPNTGRTMVYIACTVIEGEAKLVDDDELADFAWSSHQQLVEYVPYGFFSAVQDYLDSALKP
jgi:8-oxo-dGTP diphosphatase